MQLGPFQHLDVGPDYRVRRINGGDVKETGVLAFHTKVRGSTGVEMEAFCLHPQQLVTARKELEKAFPAMEGKIVISAKPEGVVFGTLATSDWWLVVDGGRLSIHPLSIMILAIDKQIRQAFQADMAKNDLADLL